MYEDLGFLNMNVDDAAKTGHTHKAWWTRQGSEFMIRGFYRSPLEERAQRALSPWQCSDPGTAILPLDAFFGPSNGCSLMSHPRVVRFKQYHVAWRKLSRAFIFDREGITLTFSSDWKIMDHNKIFTSWFHRPASARMTTLTLNHIYTSFQQRSTSMSTRRLNAWMKLYGYIDPHLMLDGFPRQPRASSVHCAPLCWGWAVSVLLCFKMALGARRGSIFRRWAGGGREPRGI